jgi:hypothetical protein
MDNAIFQYDLTQEEVRLIENIRDMVSKRKIPLSMKQYKKELTQKYGGMDKEEFMEHFTEQMGDFIVDDFLLENLSTDDKLEQVIQYIGNEVVDYLFNMYVTKDIKSSIFYDLNDTQTLTEQIVDMVMFPDYTPDSED